MYNFKFKVEDFTIFGAAFCLLPGLSSAQCPSGQLEVSMQVVTDDYGYEGYWEITEGIGTCGVNTIAWGGNDVVGCMSAEQLQTPGGYANNQTFNEGPWCFNEGSTYTLHYRDDWGDGGFVFRIIIEGAIVTEITGLGIGGDYQFQVVPAPAINAALYSRINSTDVMGPYYPQGNITLKAAARNLGSESISEMQIAYSIDGDAPVVQTLSGLNISNYDKFRIALPEAWQAVQGSYTIQMWIETINGQSDEDASNDTIDFALEIGPVQPNIIADYAGTTPVFNTIAGSAENVNHPTDLDYHSNYGLKQLWIINKGAENTGGTTVVIEQAGEPTQSSLFRQDGNAWHFMSLPTGIAFSENGNFATSPGVFDANHQGTSAAFTGPTLWSSDLDVFAQPSGGNGSHLDMLHESPYSQGIAAETDNVFWVFDGYNHDLVRYDFAEDHNPGNSWHGDAIIRRFSDDVLNRDPAGVVPSHLVLDQNKQWLYAVDNGNNRVIRIDINTGVPSAEPPSYGPHEDVVEYLTYTGYTSEIVISGGMQKPAGIALINNTLLVSDYATGKIHVFDITSLPAEELFQIQTPAQGIMGIAIDPEGRIVYADHDNSEIVMVSPGALSLKNMNESVLVYPSPADNYVMLRGNISSADQVSLLDISGRVISQFSLPADGLIEVSNLSPGIYFFRISSSNSGVTQVVSWVKS